MKVALYARVSTKQHGQDPETQLMPLREYAERREWEIIQEYIDHGWSGAKERRPQLDRLMLDAQRLKFNAVLVWRFDRFARSVKHLISALDAFRAKNIDFVSLSEQLDTSTPVGRMVFTFLGAVAEFERNMIRERVLAGVARARSEGKRFGRPRAIVDEMKLTEQFTSGRSVKSLAKEHGIAQGTVASILRARGHKKSETGTRKSPPRRHR